MTDRLEQYDSFVDEKWFVGDSDLGGLPEEAYLCICIAGEAGEVAEKLKKAYRDSGGKVDRLAMCRELGDIAFYLTRHAHLLGYTLAQVLDENIRKIADREARGVLRGSGDQR
jgi:NTP pyrophosphatase (non-canonical NTP hydrolase)